MQLNEVQKYLQSAQGVAAFGQRLAELRSMPIIKVACSIASGRTIIPTTRFPAASTTTSPTWARSPDELESLSKTDDYTVVMKLKAPNARDHGVNLAMDFATIQSAEYADFPFGGRQAGAVRPDPGSALRLIPVRDLPEADAVIRYKVFRLLGAASRRSTTSSSRSRRIRRRAWAKFKKGECCVMIAPASGRSRGDQEGQELRAGDQSASTSPTGPSIPRSRPSTRRKSVRPSTWRSTRPRSSRRSIRAPAVCREEPDPADHLVV